jgi:hypothetical protein
MAMHEQCARTLMTGQLPINPLISEASIRISRGTSLKESSRRAHPRYEGSVAGQFLCDRRKTFLLRWKQFSLGTFRPFGPFL